MRITVLMDNHTQIDRYYIGEPAVAYWIEADGKRFLLDTAYSDAFLKNAGCMGICLADADGIIFSHGHNDHTGGLAHVLRMPLEKKPVIVAHPLVFSPRAEGGMNIGSPLSLAYVKEKTEFIGTREPYWLTEHLVFLGEIPRSVAFEEPYSIGSIMIDGKEVPDMILDDSALVYKSGSGIYIITGCSHAGICNIIAYAKAVTQCSQVKGILGGFHLDKLDERTEKTIAYIAKENITELYPCHCTSFHVRAALHERSPVKDVGVGMVLEWGSADEER